MASFFFPNRPGYDLDKALDYGFRSLGIVEGTEHRRELAQACITLGKIYAWKGDSDKAIQYLQRGLSISQEMGDANLMGGHIILPVLFTNLPIGERLLNTTRKVSNSVRKPVTFNSWHHAIIGLVLFTTGVRKIVS